MIIIIIQVSRSMHICHTSLLFFIISNYNKVTILSAFWSFKAPAYCSCKYSIFFSKQSTCNKDYYEHTMTVKLKCVITLYLYFTIKLYKWTGKCCKKLEEKRGCIRIDVLYNSLVELEWEIDNIQYMEYFNHEFKSYITVN